MRFSLTVLGLLGALTLPNSGFAAEAKTEHTIMYEGGSLPLSHNKVKARFDKDAVVLVQRRHRIAVAGRDIVEISCGNEARHRFAVPVLRARQTEIHYVAVTWTDDGRKVDMLFRVDSDNYREFLASLEQLTGKKAVDTRHVPMVVRYSL